jgi:hypothetical protein
MPGAGPIFRLTPSVRAAGRGGIRRAVRTVATLPVALALTAAGAGAGLGTAQAQRFARAADGQSSSPPITVTVHPRVTPNRGGTPAHPQGVHLNVSMRFGIPLSYSPPLVSRIDAWFPRGALFEGGRYPSCPEHVLIAFGPTHCPAASILGHGGGLAMADKTPTHPQITIVGGGQHRVWFYTVMTNPARVQEPVLGTVTQLHGRWAYELSVTIPRNLQIIAGIPIVLHTLDISAGRGTWLATTGCPADHRWPWKALGQFTNGQQIATHGALACKPAHGA